MHWSLLKEMVFNELGDDPENLFASLDKRAFAAASLGQVHRARLETGEDVAVKIQYPGIARTIREDIRNLLLLMLPAKLSRDWENTKEQFDVFLGDIDSHQSPGRIYLLHSMVTHFPFAFNEHGKASRAPLTTVGAEKDVDFAALYEKYRKQAMFADSQLGAFMEKLRQEEIYDRAVIIVTADHGLRARPVLPLPEPIELDHLTTQIPLLIRAPGMDSRLSDVDYQHIDFGPTLWDVLGRPPLEGAQGVSAFSAERPVRDKVFWVDDWAYFYSSEDLAWHLGGLAAGMPEEGATGAEPEAETAGTEPAAESTYQ